MTEFRPKVDQHTIRYDHALDSSPTSLDQDPNRTYASAERRLLEVHQAILDGDQEDPEVVAAIEAALMEFNAVVPDMPQLTGKGRRLLLNAQLMALASCFESDPERRQAWQTAALERLYSARSDFEPAARMSYRGQLVAEIAKDRFAPTNLYHYVDRILVHRFTDQWYETLSKADGDDELWYSFAGNLQLDELSVDNEDIIAQEDFLQHLEANELLEQAWAEEKATGKPDVALLNASLDSALGNYSRLYRRSRHGSLTPTEKVTQAALTLTYGKALHDVAQQGEYGPTDEEMAYTTAFCALDESLHAVNELEYHLTSQAKKNGEALPYLDELGDAQLHRIRQELRDCLVPLKHIKAIREEAFYFRFYQYAKEQPEAAKAASRLTNGLLDKTRGAHEQSATHPYFDLVKIIGKHAAVIDVTSTKSPDLAT